MFKDFKPVLFILLRFTFIYVVLFLGYQWYLTQSASGGLDSFSQWVALQVQYVQNISGFSTQLHHQPENLTTWFYVKGRYVSRIVEGCNAVSVMILFAAFVFAFYRGYKTFLYVTAGLVFLHLMNVLRIAGLNMVLSDLPQLGKMTHDYLFPAFIYGMVVLLWLIWIKFFALKKDESI